MNMVIDGALADPVAQFRTRKSILYRALTITRHDKTLLVLRVLLDNPEILEDTARGSTIFYDIMIKNPVSLRRWGI